MKQLPARLTLLLLLLYPIAAFLSWIVPTLVPEWHGHSLLSAEGLRHLAANFSRDMLPPWLLTAPFVAILYGNAVAIRQNRHATDRRIRRRAVVKVVLEALVCAVILYVIALQPHAPLRGVGGEILSVQFMTALPFMLLLTAIALTTTYAWHTQQVADWSSTFRMWTLGLKKGVVWIIPLLLTVHLIATIIYAIGQ